MTKICRLIRFGLLLACCFDVMSNAEGVAAEELTADDLFRPDHVLDVRITVDPADWDRLRHQSRDFYSSLSAARKEKPPESPFTYVPATVVIDGVRFDGVGIRKKGFLGSLSSRRPSLKVKLNFSDDDVSIDGLSNLTLNNNKQDTSLVSQFLSYGLFNGAGSPAPRCGYAHVTVNGKNLGVYSHVETVRKPLLKRAFGTSKGTLYEGTVTDFYDGWENSFEKKTGKDKPGRRQIRRITEVLNGFHAYSLVRVTSYARGAVPGSQEFSDSWVGLDFDDSDWVFGRNGAGYDREGRYKGLLSSKLNFENEMYGKATSLCLRCRFRMPSKRTLNAGADNEDLRLLLYARFDDGFVAWINGQKVAAENAPEILTLNSAATRAADDRASEGFRVYDLTSWRHLLQDGDNCLAIQVLNHRADSSDLLMLPRLELKNASFEKELGQLVDLDAFYRYWALEGLLGFWDGYSGNRNNYFVYLNPKTDRMHFLPWGADALFQKTNPLKQDSRAPLSVKTQGRIAYKLYQAQASRERYERELRFLLQKHWDEERLLQEIDRVETLVGPYLCDIQEYTVDSASVRKFISTRREEIVDEIANGMPEWNRPPDPVPAFPVRPGRGRGQASDEDDEHKEADDDNLWTAARKGDVSAVKRHLAAGTDVDARDGGGGTALSTASLLGHTDVVRVLIEAGADVNARGGGKNTPLHAAAFFGQLEVAKILVRHNAEVNARNDRGETPLDSCTSDWKQAVPVVLWLADLMKVDVDLRKIHDGRPQVAAFLESHGARHGKDLE